MKLISSIMSVAISLTIGMGFISCATKPKDAQHASEPQDLKTRVKNYFVFHTHKEHLAEKKAAEARLRILAEEKEKKVAEQKAVAEKSAQKSDIKK